ncbi:MAG: thrombospondin type 3 repeat-containing protein, partial [Bacteroidales bacterium]|nr:thrombospondin type 3 repeat-containing protein [Bacteroidales bacterium]
DKGTHGYMGIWGGKNASFHHNLMAHHDSRNPRFCGSRYSNLPDQEHVDFRNNVIYNWGANSGYAGEGGSYNMVNNYYKPGPASRNRARIFQPYDNNGVWGVFYVNGNYMDLSTSVTADNWLGMHPNPSSKNKEELKSLSEFDKGQVTTHSAQNAFETVLAHAGASFKRDAVDARIAQETLTRTFTFTGSNGSTNGLIDSQADVGGWPAYASLPARIDTDGDGMPDVWETQFGLDPNDATDGKAYDLSTMFTNVEVYINSLVQHIMDQKNSTGVANYTDDLQLRGMYPSPCIDYRRRRAFLYIPIPLAIT